MPGVIGPARVSAVVRLSLTTYEQNGANLRCSLGYRCSRCNCHSKLSPAAHSLGAERLRQQPARHSNCQKQVGRDLSQVLRGQAFGVGSILRVKFNCI